MAISLQQKRATETHHRKAVAALVAAVLVFGVIVVTYVLQPVSTAPQTSADDLAAMQAIISQPNPPANLDQSEVRARQQVVSSNPPANLTQEEVRARQAVLSDF